MGKPSLLIGTTIPMHSISMALMKRNSGNVHVVQVQNFGVNDRKITSALFFMIIIKSQCHRKRI